MNRCKIIPYVTIRVKTKPVRTNSLLITVVLIIVSTSGTWVRFSSADWNSLIVFCIMTSEYVNNE